MAMPHRERAHAPRSRGEGMRGVALHSGLTIGLADELNVAPLGIGAWAWGTSRLWGYGKEYDRSDVGKAFRASMAERITLFDMAEMYGNGASERIIGEILREGGFEGRPVIATKFAPLPYRISAKSLLKAVDKSLERLGIETIDLYQIHFPNPVLNILREIGEAHNKQPAQVALNWLITQRNTFPIPGAKNEHQARQNAGALGWEMTGEEAEKLNLATLGWR